MAEPVIKLSTRDKKLSASLIVNPASLILDELDNHEEFNLTLLQNAINSEKRPKVKKILQDEQNRIIESKEKTFETARQFLGEPPAAKIAIPAESNSNVLDQIQQFLTNMWSKQ